MAPLLRKALEQHLRNWRDDVASIWQPVFKGVEPDFSAIPADLTLEPDEKIIPLRRGHPHGGAPPGSHIFKALDTVSPDQVRAVLLGQDPYPDIRDATGISFQQGGLNDWHQDHVALSLRRVVQVLADHRWGVRGWGTSDAEWPQWRAAFRDAVVPMQTPPELFEHWAREGVLCINLGLTLSRFDKRKYSPPRRPAQAAHMAMWTPVIRAILIHLASRINRPLLLMLWGGKAQQAVEAMDLASAAQRAGATAPMPVPKRHPAYEVGKPAKVPFLDGPNPFTEADMLMRQRGFEVVRW
ncbi:MAG: hypothetical protein LCH73_01045 [Proteobacteria bacterium]|nr:hypothetical protein [Pseudomonadota bacterium]